MNDNYGESPLQKLYYYFWLKERMQRARFELMTRSIRENCRERMLQLIDEQSPKPDHIVTD